MKTCWDLSHLYSNHKDWELDFDRLKKNTEDLGALVDSILDTPKSFHDFIVSKIENDELMERVYCYPTRHVDIDNSLEEYKEDKNRALEIYDDIISINSKFESLIIDNFKLVNKYMNNKELKEYDRYIYLILRRNMHMIDNIDTFKKYDKDIRDVKSNYRSLINDMKFNDITINGEEIEINKQSYSRLINDSNRSVRKDAFNSYTDGYKKIEKEIKGLYDLKIVNSKKIASLEHYNNLLEKELFELELPEEIVTELVKEVNNNLDILHSYNEYKKNKLKLDELHIYDLNVPLNDSPDIDYVLEESIDIVKKSLSILGNDYIELIDKMFNEGWIDVYPKDGKRSMSYTCISYVGVPYILINYNGTLTSTRTLAHEIGHSVNTYLSSKNNKFEYYEFNMFLTEIASKVNEIIFNEYIINNYKDKKETIETNIISSLINSVFNQTMLTEFEINYNDKPNELYLELYKRYNGNNLTYDDNIKYNWLRIPHFIMQDNYYLYKYAIGTMIACNIAYRIINKENNINDKYKKFLSVGSSINIEDALKIVDIDLNNKEYINKTMNIIREKVKNLSKR